MAEDSSSHCRESSSADLKIAAMDPGGDTSEMLMDQVQVAVHNEIQKLPGTTSESPYMVAMARAPELVRSESGPFKFCQVENGNVRAAAERVRAHWEFRQFLFRDRMLLPLRDLSGAGAMTEPDIQGLKTGIVEFLPDDPQGRKVMFFNSSKAITGDGNLTQEERLRRFRCVFHLLSTIDSKEWMLMRYSDNPQFYQAPMEQVIRAFKAFPIKLCTVAIVSMPPPGARRMFENTVIPVLTKVFEKTKADVLSLVADSPVEMMHALRQHGFSDESALPECVGGSWSCKNLTRWVDAQITRCSIVHTDAKSNSALPRQEAASHGPDETLGLKEPPAQDSSETPVTSDICAKVHTEVQRLPGISAYMHSYERAPHLVRMESEAVKFFHLENGNLVAAATRIRTYWELRKSLFGDRFLLPLGDLEGAGALTQEDIEVLRSGTFFFLPQDTSGRAILFVDTSGQIAPNCPDKATRRMRHFRCLFFMVSTVESPELVVVRYSDDSEIVQLGALPKLLQVFTAFPTILTCMIWLQKSQKAAKRHFEKSILPDLGRTFEENCDAKLVTVIDESLVELRKALREHGFCDDSCLPERVGGTWSGCDGLNAWLDARIVARRVSSTVRETKPAISGAQDSLHLKKPAVKSHAPQNQLPTTLGAPSSDPSQIVSSVHNEIQKLSGITPASPYMIAHDRAPDLVRTESDPVKIYRLEKGNVQAAASRIRSHWELRELLFGDRYLLPLGDLSGAGAMAEYDIEALREGMEYFLPVDSAGRAVLWLRKSRSRRGGAPEQSKKLPRFRCIFYMLSTIECQQFVIIKYSDDSELVPQAAVQQLVRAFEAFPTKFCSMIWLQRCPAGAKRTFENTFVPVLRRGFDEASNVELDAVVAESSVELREALRTRGFVDDSALPECVGGTWSQHNLTAWIDGRLAASHGTRLHRHLEQSAPAASQKPRPATVIDRAPFKHSRAKKEPLSERGGGHPVAASQVELSSSRGAPLRTAGAVGLNVRPTTGRDDDKEDHRSLVERRRARKRLLDAEYARQRRSRERDREGSLKRECTRLLKENSALKEQEGILHHLLESAQSVVQKVAGSPPAIFEERQQQQPDLSIAAAAPSLPTEDVTDELASSGILHQSSVHQVYSQATESGPMLSSPEVPRAAGIPSSLFPLAPSHQHHHHESNDTQHQAASVMRDVLSILQMQGPGRGPPAPSQLLAVQGAPQRNARFDAVNAVFGLLQSAKATPSQIPLVLQESQQQPSIADALVSLLRNTSNRSSCSLDRGTEVAPSRRAFTQPQQDVNTLTIGRQQQQQPVLLIPTAAVASPPPPPAPCTAAMTTTLPASVEQHTTVLSPPRHPHQQHILLATPSQLGAQQQQNLLTPGQHTQILLTSAPPPPPPSDLAAIALLLSQQQTQRQPSAPETTQLSRAVESLLTTQMQPMPVQPPPAVPSVGPVASLSQRDKEVAIAAIDSAIAALTAQRLQEQKEQEQGNS